MKIKWYGHACFELESKEGVKVITDPFNEQVGYDVPNVKADIVTVSHDHFDHNYLEMVEDGYTLIKETGRHSIKGIDIEGFNTYHDDSFGSKRGKNIVYKFIIDNIIVCHLGDLGHILNNEQLDAVGNVDVLLIPVGGTFTIDSKQAHDLVHSISPKIIIPMHYKTDKLTFNLEPVDNFVKYFKNVNYLNTNEIQVSEETLKDHKKIIVLNYE